MHPAVVEQLSMLPAAKQVPGSAIERIIQLFLAHKSPAHGVLPLLLKLAMLAYAAAADAATIAMPTRSTAFPRVRTSQEMMSA
jgi:hypothetical protein